jgi:hypothetical protein
VGADAVRRAPTASGTMLDAIRLAPSPKGMSPRLSGGRESRQRVSSPVLSCGGAVRLGRSLFFARCLV